MGDFQVEGVLFLDLTNSIPTIAISVSTSLRSLDEPRDQSPAFLPSTTSEFAGEVYEDVDIIDTDAIFPIISTYKYGQLLEITAEQDEDEDKIVLQETETPFRSSYKPGQPLESISEDDEYSCNDQRYYTLFRLAMRVSLPTRHSQDARLMTCSSHSTIPLASSTSSSMELFAQLVNAIDADGRNPEDVLA